MKFRCYSLDQREMIECECIEGRSAVIVESVKPTGRDEILFLPPDRYSKPMLATGLHDKNETPIYVGDLVKVVGKGIYEIEFWNGSCVFNVNGTRTPIKTSWVDYQSNIRIIGNICQGVIDAKS